MTLYSTVTDILREYPQKVTQWYPLDSCFTADRSDFGGGDIKDPWNGPFKKFIEIKDGEGDLIKWDCLTIVNGQEVRCILYND